MAVSYLEVLEMQLLNIFLILSVAKESGHFAALI